MLNKIQTARLRKERKRGPNGCTLWYMLIVTPQYTLVLWVRQQMLLVCNWKCVSDFLQQNSNK